jgi:hypothetical protein
MKSCLRTIVVGFVAGAVSVLVFHQAGFWIANELGYARATLYNPRPLPPWGVPTILSQAFWGGAWGILIAFVVPRLPRPLSGALGWILFAAIIVTLVNWFVVLPLKGLPTGGGFRMPAPIVLPLVYGLWGLGMWLIERLLRRVFGWG